METNSLGLLHQYLSKKNVRVYLGERQQFAEAGARVEETNASP